MASDRSVKRLAAFLLEIGYRDDEIIVKSDQESAITAVADTLPKDRGEAQTIAESLTTHRRHPPEAMA